MAIGDANDVERLELSARRAKTVPLAANGRPDAESTAASSVS
jgi:hypothetical protein